MANEVKRETPQVLTDAIEQVTKGLNENFTPRNFDPAELELAQKESSMPAHGERGQIFGHIADIYANGLQPYSVGFNPLGREFVEKKLAEKGLNPEDSRMLAAHKALAA